MLEIQADIWDKIEDILEIAGYKLLRSNRIYFMNARAA